MAEAASRNEKRKKTNTYPSLRERREKKDSKTQVEQREIRNHRLIRRGEGVKKASRIRRKNP